MNCCNESERFFRLERKAKQAIRGCPMQPDAVQTENKLLKCRVILLGALSSIHFFLKEKCCQVTEKIHRLRKTATR